MNQPEPVAVPVYLRVGEGREEEVATLHPLTATELVYGLADALTEAAEALRRAAAYSPDSYTLAPPEWEGEHGPETIQHSPRGSLYDLSNEAAQAAWPTTPPPAPGG
ncbi:hypothetical protein ACFVAM_01855 [Streptomyces californicus]|uniref:hypothetical protein n=1 Tax=Streptomyces californicus TaxID=67351 RepID=UPI0036AB16A7